MESLVNYSSEDDYEDQNSKNAADCHGSRSRSPGHARDDERRRSKEYSRSHGIGNGRSQKEDEHGSRSKHHHSRRNRSSSHHREDTSSSYRSNEKTREKIRSKEHRDERRDKKDEKRSNRDSRHEKDERDRSRSREIEINDDRKRTDSRRRASSSSKNRDLRGDEKSGLSSDYYRSQRETNKHKDNNRSSDNYERHDRNDRNERNERNRDNSNRDRDRDRDRHHRKRSISPQTSDNKRYREKSPYSRSDRKHRSRSRSRSKSRSRSASREINRRKHDRYNDNQSSRQQSSKEYGGRALTAEAAVGIAAAKIAQELRKERSGSPESSYLSKQAQSRTEALLSLPLNESISNKVGINSLKPLMSIKTSHENTGNANTLTTAPPIALPAYYNPNVINPNKYVEQMQKRKLIWGAKKTEDVSAKWNHAKFSQDSDGKVASKFMRLMGIKTAPKVDPTENQKTEPDPTVGSTTNVSALGTVTTSVDVKSREAMFSKMEHQYEVARQVTHTMRGVGLGFSSQPRQF